jgi:hypothetical protein
MEPLYPRLLYILEYGGRRLRRAVNQRPAARARVLRKIARELDSPRYAVAEELERAAIEELTARRPDRVLRTNVELWSAVVGVLPYTARSPASAGLLRVWGVAEAAIL